MSDSEIDKELPPVRQTLCKRLSRCKFVDETEIDKTPLKRCLKTIDLTLLAIGSILGQGVYVVAGVVAREDAGPSIIVSFLISGLIALLAGSAYAEFGARVPKAGSGYVYIYAVIGELTSFIVGWNMILEYAIGSASQARAMSTYLDAVCNNSISNWLREVFPLSGTMFSTYFDWPAFFFSLIIAGILAIGVKETTSINNVVTCFNISVVVFICIVAIMKGDISNWESIYWRNSTTTGKFLQNSFFPFGLTGTLTGAATCFYGYCSFECIATTGEEVIDPIKSIPKAIIYALTICMTVYVAIGAAITLIIPYYDINIHAALYYIFENLGQSWMWAKYCVGIGAVIGISMALLGSMFPLPRVVYAMAGDGIIFRFFAFVERRLKTPVIATVAGGFLTAIVSAIFSLSDLVEMMSIGTLVAYSVVSAAVIILRCQPILFDYVPMNETSVEYEEQAIADDIQDLHTKHWWYVDSSFEIVFTAKEKDWRTVLKSLFTPEKRIATKFSGSLIVVVLLLATIFGALTLLISTVFYDNLAEGEIICWIPLILFFILTVIFLVSVYCQPKNLNYETFKCPMVPTIPLISILANIFLIMKLNYLTWIRFSIWMAIGLFIYFFYGLYNSTEELRYKKWRYTGNAKFSAPVPSVCGIRGAESLSTSQITSRRTSIAPIYDIGTTARVAEFPSESFDLEEVNGRLKKAIPPSYGTNE